MTSGTTLMQVCLFNPMKIICKPTSMSCLMCQGQSSGSKGGKGLYSRPGTTARLRSSSNSITCISAWFCFSSERLLCGAGKAGPRGKGTRKTVIHFWLQDPRSAGPGNGGQHRSTCWATGPPAHLAGRPGGRHGVHIALFLREGFGLP